MSDYINGGPPKTREDFWLHFACGFVVGGLVGFRFVGRHVTGDSVAAFLLAVLVCALVIGFIAGSYLDRFWEALVNWFRWR